MALWQRRRAPTPKPVDEPQLQLAQLQDRAREEREERRGLEQRAGQLIAAATVALALLVGGVARPSASGVAVGVTVAAATGTLVGLLYAAWALVPDTSLNWRRLAILRSKNAGPVVPLPIPPAQPSKTDLEVEAHRAGKLEHHNVRMVVILRVATALVAVGVYVGSCTLLIDAWLASR